MRRFLIPLFLLALLAAEVSGQSSDCRPATGSDIPHGANMSVEVHGGTVNELRGTITDANGAEFSDAVVEVYKVRAMAANRDAQRAIAGQTRLAACVTGPDGKFNFADLPSGQYVLHVGMRTNMGICDAYWIGKLQIKNRPSRARPRAITIQLSPGT